MSATTARLLVPVDGSPASLRAAGHAAELVRLGAAQKVLLINVQHEVMSGEISPLVTFDEVNRDRNSAAEAALEPAQAVFAAAGLPVERKIEFGDPAETIARVAREARCSQIVMGTRGLGIVANLVLGSVAAGVLRHVDIPVTLVK